MKKRMHVISNTHWDREHRHSFPATQFMLTELMDELVEILEGDENYKYFTLDGQSIMIDDYLEVKPYMKERLEKLIKDGRILIGPWYSLVDCYSVNQESIVRNLLTGKKKCESIADYMKVGYSIFSFGQIAQLPQIYSGFGIKDVLFYKGSNAKVFPKSEFVWNAPDGTAVLANRLGNYKRWNFSFCFTMPVIFGGTPTKLGWDSKFSENYRLCHMIDEDKKHFYANEASPDRRIRTEEIDGAIDALIEDTDASNSENIRIGFDGTDFIPPTREVPEAISIANSMQEKMELVHSNPVLYFEDFRKDVDVDGLQKYCGELRYGPVDHLHSETMGSNIELKIADFKAENKLINVLEPLNVFSMLSGGAYDKDQLELVWKNLFKTHAHDSIHGSGDPHIKTDNLNRLEQINEMEDYLIRRACENICREINVDGLEDNETGIVVFNTCPYEKSQVVTVYADLPLEDIPENPVIYDGDERVEVYYSAQEQFTMGMINRSNRPKSVRCVRVKMMAYMKNVPAMGYKMLTLSWTKGDPTKNPAPFPPGVFPYNPIGKGADVLDNGVLRVSVNADGTLNVFDYVAKREYNNLHYFTDEGCSGDFWVHRQPRDNSVYSSKTSVKSILIKENSGLKATLEIKYEMDIPKGLSADGNKRSDVFEKMLITTDVTLEKDSRRLDFKTEIQNNSNNHLLTMVIPTGVQTNEVLCDSAFEQRRRPIGNISDNNGRRGDELLRFAVQTFADVSDEKGGVTLITQGNKEMYAEENCGCSFNVTMLRAVSGKFPVHDDCFLTFENENADCKGTFDTRYALYFHDAESNVSKESKKYLTNLSVMQLGHGTGGSLSDKCSFMGADFELSCVKRGEESNAIVMRLYNPTDKVQKGCAWVRGAKGARLCSLAEEELEPLVIENGKAQLEIEPYKIVTVMFDME